MRPGNYENERRTVSIDLPAIYWERVDRLVAASDRWETVDDFMLSLLDHVQQGVYRSGAWERFWLVQVCGPDAVETAWDQDEDPL